MKKYYRIAMLILILSMISNNKNYSQIQLLSPKKLDGNLKKMQGIWQFYEFNKYLKVRTPTNWYYLIKNDTNFNYVNNKIIDTTVILLTTDCGNEETPLKKTDINYIIGNKWVDTSDGYRVCNNVEIDSDTMWLYMGNIPTMFKKVKSKYDNTFNFKKVTLQTFIFSTPKIPTKMYLQKGDEVEVIEEKSGWLRIRFYGKKVVEGWIKKGDLE